MGSLNSDGSRISQTRRAVKRIGGALVFSADRQESEVEIDKSAAEASSLIGTDADRDTVKYSTYSNSVSLKTTGEDGELIERVSREVADGSDIDQNPPWVGLGGGGGGGSQDLESVLAEGNTGSGIILNTLQIDETSRFVGVATFEDSAIFNNGATFEEDLVLNSAMMVADANRISFRNNNLGLQANSDGVLSLFDSGSNLRPFAAAKHLEVITMASGASIELASQSGQVIVVKGTGPRTVNLQARDLYHGYIVDVKDGDGTSSSGNITIDGNGKNIDGESSFVVDTNYASYTFIYNGTEWNLI